MTVEEKSERYIKNGWWKLNVAGWKARMKEAFIAGHAAAMRWRDPEKELPETGKPVLVKYRTAKNVEKHGIGKYFNIGIGNPWTIEGSTSRSVIGWRPIE